MRKVLLGAFSVMVSLGLATSANALGDVCHGAISAKGNKKHDEHAARMSAIAAWQNKARCDYDDRFANWNYSGDRSISCNWNASGTKFWCVATARPCARVD